MLRLIDVKPIHPKNGDKYRTKEGIFEFRFGRWIKISNPILEEKK